MTLNNLDSFYENLNPEIRECLLALRDIIMDTNKDIRSAYKYGAPFFYYKGKILCYIWIERKSGEPYVGFYYGYLLNHPELEAGNRKQIKILKIDVYRDLPIQVIKIILLNAIDHY